MGGKGRAGDVQHVRCLELGPKIRMGDFRLEPGAFALIFSGQRIEPAFLERNMAGFCSKCDGELESIAYHRLDREWLVSAHCQKEHYVLIRFDLEWGWLGDHDLELARETKSISVLPKEQLEAVFSPGELKTLEAVEQGKPYLRQSLYRARAKFEKFEKLFGLKIKL